MWYYGVSYGSPAIVVLLSFLLDPRSYRSEDYCWIQTSFALLCFVGPSVLVALVSYFSFKSSKLYHSWNDDDDGMGVHFAQNYILFHFPCPLLRVTLKCVLIVLRCHFSSCVLKSALPCNISSHMKLSLDVLWFGRAMLRQCQLLAASLKLNMYKNFIPVLVSFCCVCVSC